MPGAEFRQQLLDVLLVLRAVGLPAFLLTLELALLLVELSLAGDKAGGLLLDLSLLLAGPALELLPSLVDLQELLGQLATDAFQLLPTR